MDDLTRRYAKALTAELEARHCLERWQGHVERIERGEMLRHLEGDPKAPEWRLKMKATDRLDGIALYRNAVEFLALHRHLHYRAKARLKVIEERLSHRRAELYAQGRRE